MMETIQKVILRIKAFLQEKDLYDVRVLILIGIGFVSISVFWSGAKIVQQNFELAQKVREIEQENEVLKLENQNKALRNQYYATDEYAELYARRVNGKAAPGERLYIVPKEAALAALSEQEPTETQDIAEIQKPQYQKNLEAWMNIYFGN